MTFQPAFTRSGHRIKVLFVFGTRPEAIKLCPVVRYLRARPSEFDVRVSVTAQHRQLLDSVLSTFDVTPDYDLDSMQPGQTLSQSTSRIVAGLEPILQAERPDMVVVQGDTTTTLCGALAAFYQKIPVGHVEAGLRTWDVHQPFPEEMNRVLTGRLSSLHFAATQWSANNLVGEGVDPAHVIVTGNSGIDAVFYVRDAIDQGHWRHSEADHSALWSRLDASKKLLVVTAHRRESFGEGFEHICRGLLRLANREDVQIVYPVHPNPNVREPVSRHLAGHPRILLTAPLEYVPFVDLMRRAYLLVTDSGGVQEEGPSLGKPILVLREKTERPEAVEAGTVRLVGIDEDRLYREATRLLDSTYEYERMSRIHNPYGDGRASERIAASVARFFANTRPAELVAKPA